MLEEYAPADLTPQQREAVMSCFMGRISVRDETALLTGVENAIWCYHTATTDSPDQVRASLTKLAENCTATARQLRLLSEATLPPWRDIQRMILADPIALEDSAGRLEGLAAIANDLVKRHTALTLRHRPVDEAKRWFVSSLAEAYRRGTGREPRWSENSHFCAFVSTVSKATIGDSVSPHIVAQTLQPG